MKPNFCFLASANGFLAFNSIGIGKYREVVEALHLQELCEQPPSQLPLLHFLQDLPLQPFLCSDFLDFSFEQDRSVFVEFLEQAKLWLGIIKKTRQKSVKMPICIL